jgi:hypothetical protein
MRRLVFATVIVASCKRPIEPRWETPEQITPITRSPPDAAVAHAIADAPVDARVDAPIDAFPRITRRCTSLHRESCRDGPDDCNPLPPPQQCVARLHGIRDIGPYVLVTLGVGEGNGVTWTTTAEFVDHDDVPLPNGRCVIVRFDKVSTKCEVKLTPEQIGPNPRVLVRIGE